MGNGLIRATGFCKFYSGKAGSKVPLFLGGWGDEVTAADSGEQAAISMVSS